MPSYCCSSSDFLQSHYTVLLFSFLLPFSCTSWCCSLPCIFQILQIQINSLKNFCSDPGFFLLMMVAKDLTGCFSHCCVEGGDHRVQIYIFIVHNGERCKLPAYILAYPPNCIFRNKNRQNPEQSLIFQNTSANVSPHLWNKSSYQSLRENHRAIYTVHLPYRFRAAESTACRSRLTVCQFNHFTTLLRTSEFTQVSPFSSTVAKDHFSWCTFLNLWKWLLFAGDGLAGAWSIDSAMLSVMHKMFSQMAALFQSIWLAALQKLLLLCVFRARAEHSWE